LARVNASDYRETLWSKLYPGNRNSCECLIPAATSIETTLNLAPQESVAESALDLASPASAKKSALDLAQRRRRRVLWRLDGGFGTFKNLQWLLARDYHVLSKGFSSNSAKACVELAQRWTPFNEHWIASVPCPFPTTRQVTTWLLRRFEKDRFIYNYYVTTLSYPSLAAAMRAYQQRGGAEIEQFRNDKQGLHLSMRRKRSIVAQEGLVILTDLAHNLLADFYNVALIDSAFRDFGLKRIVRDLLNMAGHLSWTTPDELCVTLQRVHPYSKDLLDCLVKYCQHHQLAVSNVA
jgi:hypothetical protein